MVCKALASLDQIWLNYSVGFSDFNPQGSREPRRAIMQRVITRFIFQSTRLSRASTSWTGYDDYLEQDFNPQGSREPRHVGTRACVGGYGISIHKALASLDLCLFYLPVITSISIHKALASLDGLGYPCSLPRSHFNPQGSREPRRSGGLILEDGNGFQSTRLSRASTIKSLS